MRIACHGRARIPFHSGCLVEKPFSAPGAVAKFWSERPFREALRPRGIMKRSMLAFGYFLFGWAGCSGSDRQVDVASMQSAHCVQPVSQLMRVNRKTNGN